jgi:hypothetical protein
MSNVKSIRLSKSRKLFTVCLGDLVNLEIALQPCFAGFNPGLYADPLPTFFRFL